MPGAAAAPAGRRREGGFGDGEANALTGRPGPTVYVSNGASVRRRQEALYQAIREAEAMQLQLLTGEEITTRLTMLRDSIPAVEPLLVEQGEPFTPAELREARWRAEEEARR